MNRTVEHPTSEHRGNSDDPASELVHDVHVFAIVRVKISGIKAIGHREAIRCARAAVNFYDLFESCTMKRVECVEFAEEFSHYMVDEVGDEEYERSRWYEDGPNGTAEADYSAWRKVQT